MTILRVESLIFGVEDLDAGTRYFEDWGLARTSSEANGADFALPSGQTILLRSSKDASLPAAPDRSPTLRETIWGVSDAAALQRVGAELGRDRDVKSDAGGLHARDEAGFAIGFRVAAPAPQSSSTAAPRMNHPFDPERRARPSRLGHVVFNAAQKDFEKQLAFYLERLKFRLSDRALDTGAFLRAQGSNDHHSLFFATRADRNSFNHAAFEVKNIDEIVLGGKYMKSRGWKPNTPLGRHILGSNVFWYFDSPCGGRTEYYSDMDQMNDDWKPRIWEKNPGFAMWMIDPDEVPAVRLG